MPWGVVPAIGPFDALSTDDDSSPPVAISDNEAAP
jgi:hypothetical protein